MFNFKQIFLLFLFVGFGSAVLDPSETVSESCNAGQIFFEKIANLSNVKYFVLFRFSDYSLSCIQMFRKVKPAYLITVGPNSQPQIIFNVKSSIMHEQNLHFLFLQKVTYFENVLEEITSMHFWKRRQRIILIGNVTHGDVKIFSQLAFEKYWVTNLIFMNQNFSTLMRYNPFSNQLLTSQSLDLIFQNIADNFYGKEIKIAMFENLLAIWEDDHYKKRDGYITTAVVRALNATVKYIPAGVGKYGDILKNGSFNGGELKLVYDGIADASFNTRFMVAYAFEYADFTYTHTLDVVQLFLPVRTKEVGNLLTILPVEYVAIGAVVSGIFSVYIKKYGRLPLGKLLIINMELITSRGVQMINVKFFRMFLISLIVYYMYLTNIFQARLISVLTTVEKVPKLTRIYEAAESEYTFITEDVFYGILSIFEGPDTDSFLKILSRTTFMPTGEFVDRMTKCPVEGLINTQKLAHHYISVMAEDNDFTENCFYALEQHLVPVVTSYLLRYGSPLYDKVNEVIQKCIESGLQLYWEQTKRTLPVSDNRVSPPMKLAFENVAFGFYVLFLGWILSLIVFLWEIIVGHKVYGY